jgi:hypothetical protein
VLLVEVVKKVMVREVTVTTVAVARRRVLKVEAATAALEVAEEREMRLAGLVEVQVAVAMAEEEMVEAVQVVGTEVAAGTAMERVLMAEAAGAALGLVEERETRLAAVAGVEMAAATRVAMRVACGRRAPHLCKPRDRRTRGALLARE